MVQRRHLGSERRTKLLRHFLFKHGCALTDVTLYLFSETVHGRRLIVIPLNVKLFEEDSMFDHSASAQVVELVFCLRVLTFQIDVFSSFQLAANNSLVATDDI